MKKLLTLLAVIMVCSPAFSQGEYIEDEPRGFKKERVFIGASLGLGLGSGVFNVGANPEVGYSITNWLDAGLSTNFNYTTIRPEYNFGYRQRSTTYGGGVFVRVHAFRGFFLQALPEYNRRTIRNRFVQAGGPDDRYKLEAPSFLAGVGYGGRVIGQSGFFTVLMFDLANNSNSPYINSYVDNNGNAIRSRLPVLRTGFNVYLGPKRRR
ncbi:hypothetical protein EXU57_05200 [Segetibacter sp. 3557_3]|uniref:hypothetical protein n=1 Tax=Segetibacter sp. 3557_3 TaxID=2547429 RepID=UPI0010586158|nr:hypothetical protein [Segetibacter sp. 3557_3]TDH27864.1 hypothetical protein EXU57_05200 [Segetibacter sp. 3557_3]